MQTGVNFSLSIEAKEQLKFTGLPLNTLHAHRKLDQVKEVLHMEYGGPLSLSINPSPLPIFI